MFAKFSNLFKSRNQTRVEPILVIEIESGSVACALVLINHADKVCPVVKYYQRQYFSYNPDNNSENYRDFFNLLFGTIEKTISVVFKQIEKYERPTAIHCFSGSPLYLSQTQHLYLNEEKPFRITPLLIKRLIDDQLLGLIEKFPFLNPAFSGDNAVVVESKLIKLCLNGYEVPNPYKFKAKKLELVYFSSLASAKVVKQIESILGGFYSDLPLSWHSIAFALFNSIDINPNSLPNLMIISTGGLNTEIIIIKDRIISEVVSIPFGEESIIQMLQQKLNRPLAEIRSLLTLQSSANMTVNSQPYLTPHLDQIKIEWHKHFNDGLKALTANIFLPRNLLIVGHGPVGDLMFDWIKTENLNKLSPDYLGNKCTYQGNADGAKDIHLMAEIIFCDTLIKQGQNL